MYVSSLYHKMVTKLLAFFAKLCHISLPPLHNFPLQTFTFHPRLTKKDVSMEIIIKSLLNNGQIEQTLCHRSRPSLKWTPPPSTTDNRNPQAVIPYPLYYKCITSSVFSSDKIYHKTGQSFATAFGPVGGIFSHLAVGEAFAQNISSPSIAKKLQLSIKKFFRL